MTWQASAFPAVGAALTAVGLLWAVISWRRAGSHLRVQAFLYGEELSVCVFNAGRTAVTIERAVLGGRRGGLGGQEVTELLALPLRLEPGSSHRWPLGTDQLSAHRLSWARQGWDSLWLLLGSMRQQRVEVLPVKAAKPPTVGWRLAPRRVKVSRHAPLAAVPVLALASARDAGDISAVVLTVFGVVLAVRACASALGRTSFARLRVERWVLALGGVLALVVRGTDASGPLSYLVTGYVVLALLLSVPGALTTVADAVDELRRTATRVVGKVKKPRDGPLRRRLRRC